MHVMVRKNQLTRRSVLIGGLSGLAMGGSVFGMSSQGSQNANENAAISGHETIYLEKVGGYSANAEYEDGGAEIVSYDEQTEQAFVANSSLGVVDVLDVSDPTDPTKVEDIDITEAIDWPEADEVTSVAVKDGLLAAGVSHETPTEEGRVVIATTNPVSVKSDATVGALPDGVAFTPDGSTIVVANEGEPSDDFQTVPEGSVSIVSIADFGWALNVEEAGFEQFNGQEEELRERGIRIFGPEQSLTAAQNIEPEYATVSPDGSTAWVALQEANALAEVDIDSATVTELHALGTKDHMLPGNEFDGSDDDGGINIRNWPTHGMYQPDGIATYESNGNTFVVSPNEGDARDFDGYSEETEVSDLDLDEEAFNFDRIAGIDSVEELQEEHNLGELETTTANGDTDGDGQVEEIYSYGARSFSIWDDEGNLVFDSGNELEQITAERYPENFNNDNDESDPDGRSDAKGPEPEGVSIGEIDDKVYAFISLERISGVVVYDVTTPEDAEFVQYINPRDFSVDIEEEIVDGPLPTDAAGDVGTEDVGFVSASDSPIDTPIVLTANEASATVGVFRVDIE